MNETLNVNIFFFIFSLSACGGFWVHRTPSEQSELHFRKPALHGNNTLTWYTFIR